jgi:hypothetical protein
MAWTAAEACSALAKGWRKRGMSKERVAKAHAKCMRNYKAPKGKGRRKAKRR